MHLLLLVRPGIEAKRSPSSYVFDLLQFTHVACVWIWQAEWFKNRKHKTYCYYLKTYVFSINVRVSLYC